MGLLDEAIREHLDLKRRRGADPGEIDRAEREALGPVRREPFEPEVDQLGPARAGGAYDQGEELYDDQQLAEAPLSDERDWGDAFEEEAELPPTEAPNEGHGLDDATRVMGSTPFEDELETGEQRPGPAPYSAGGVGDETVEYNIDEAIAGEEGETRPGPNDSSPGERESLPPEGDVGPRTELEPDADLKPQPGSEKPHGEDMLEETPDFLQDTPDHDRLWFEQRPPRDFDFDD